jgi:hypothetical protein
VKLVVVTGWRHWPDDGSVERELEMENPDTVIVGHCPTGADKYAASWARRNPRVELQVFLADWRVWSAIGRQSWADPVRNYEMAKAAFSATAYSEKLVLAFPGPRPGGTQNCLDLARAFRLPTRVVRFDHRGQGQ